MRTLFQKRLGCSSTRSFDAAGLSRPWDQPRTLDSLLGNVDFTGRAYGLVDNMLSLDAGDVTVANLTFRPEVRLPTDGLPVAESR
jgi:hypothetical protein